MATDDKAKAKGKAGAATPPAAGKKKLPVMIIGVVALIGAAAAAYFFLQSRQASPAAKTVEKSTSAPLQFYTLDPPFVSNFEGMQAYRFLQVHVRLATRSEETLKMLEGSDPILRNDLLLLFSAQNATTLSTKEGKDQLRTDALKLVRDVVKSAGGDPQTVESVLFTSFVMQ